MFIEIINDPILHIAAISNSGTFVHPRVYRCRSFTKSGGKIMAMSRFDRVNKELARTKDLIKDKGAKVDFAHRETLASIQAARERRVNAAKDRFQEKIDKFREVGGQFS